MGDVVFFGEVSGYSRGGSKFKVDDAVVAEGLEDGGGRDGDGRGGGN